MNVFRSSGGSMVIGSKPKYITSGKSSFMKELEVELREKRQKDAKDRAEFEEALAMELGEEPGPKVE